jgi:hypothetical protein
MEFQVKLAENLISKCHITEERPSDSSQGTDPPRRMNIPHYSHIAAAV